MADLPLSGNTTGAVPAPDWSGIPAAPGPAIGASDTTPSPRGQAVGVARRSRRRPAVSRPGPAARPAPALRPAARRAGGQHRRYAVDRHRRRWGARSGAGTGPATGASQPGRRRPPRLPPPAPVPVPVPVPAPPAASAAATPPPAPELVEGVTCNVLGNLVPDLPAPVCPSADLKQ